MSEPTILFKPLLGAARLTAYLAWTILLIPVQAVAVGLRLPLGRRLPRFYHTTCCRLLGIRLQVIGKRCRTRPTLYVSNHSSYLDITVFGALLGASFVAKAEVTRWPLFGLLAKLQRSVFVDRRLKSTRGQIAQIRARLARRDRLIMFAEGTSSDGVGVLPFKSALFSVADVVIKERPLPVQPVTVAYTRLDGIPIGRHLRPFFAWYGDMALAPHLWQLLCLGQTTATVVFHDPVTIRDFSSRKALADHCQAAVAQGYAQAIGGEWAGYRGRRRRRRATAGVA